MKQLTSGILVGLHVFSVGIFFKCNGWKFILVLYFLLKLLIYLFIYLFIHERKLASNNSNNNNNNNNNKNNNSFAFLVRCLHLLTAVRDVTTL